MSQNTIVLKMLQKAGKRGITAFDGLSRNIFRLGARIYELRHQGHKIKTLAESHGASSGAFGKHARYILEPK